MNLESGVTISSVKGHQISAIEISGNDVVINDLCTLISSKQLNLISEIQIHDATLKSFKKQQLQNCDTANAKDEGKITKVCTICFQTNISVGMPSFNLNILCTKNIIYVKEFKFRFRFTILPSK